MNRTTQALVLVVLLTNTAACGRRDELAASSEATLPEANTATKPESQPPIERTALEISPSRQTLTLAGKVAYGEDRYSRISSPVQGRVLEVRARLGDRVKAGDVLLVVDSPDIAQAYSDFIREHSELGFTTRSYELAKGLYQAKALPVKDLKQAENDLMKARAEFRRAKERLLSLHIPTEEIEQPVPEQHITSRFELRSPLSGAVVERTITPGQSVSGDPSQLLFTVADLDQLQVIADVYERDLALVHPEQRAAVTVEAYRDETFPAVVAAVGNVVDPYTRTIKVRAWINNDHHMLKPEMFARLRLELGDGQAVPSIPKEAVRKVHGKE